MSRFSLLLVTTSRSEESGEDEASPGDHDGSVVLEIDGHFADQVEGGNQALKSVAFFILAGITWACAQRITCALINMNSVRL